MISVDHRGHGPQPALGPDTLGYHIAPKNVYIAT